MAGNVITDSGLQLRRLILVTCIYGDNPKRLCWNFRSNFRNRKITWSLNIEFNIKNTSNVDGRAAQRVSLMQRGSRIQIPLCSHSEKNKRRTQLRMCVRYLHPRHLATACTWPKEASHKSQWGNDLQKSRMFEGINWGQVLLVPG